MGKVCEKCEDPSWTGQDPIVAPELPSDGGGVKVVDELPEKGQQGMAYVLVDDLEDPTSSQGIFVYDNGWVLTAQPVSEAVQKVDELPDEGQPGILYYVPKTGDDTYDLYRWVDNSWIKVDTDIKLYGSTGTNTDGAMTQKAVTESIEAVKGMARELTSADYDYPDANPTGVALWRKDAGMYYWKQGVNVYINTSMLHSDGESAVVFKAGAYYLDILSIYPGGDKNTYTWYKVVASTGAGANVGTNTYNHILSEANVVLSTGTSNTDVMSQNATTSMVFNDPGTKEQIRIGKSSSINNSSKSIAIGSEATASHNSTQSIAIGSEAKTTKGYSVALGSHAETTRQGEVNVGSGRSLLGYNSSAYRVIGGVYDGQEVHDAATYGQLISYSAINGAGAPTTATEGKYVGQLYYDTTNGKLYICTDATNPYVWEEVGGGSVQYYSNAELETLWEGN